MNYSRKTYLSIALICLTLLIRTTGEVRCQSPGSLDTSFGTDGKVLVSVLPDATGNAGRKAILDQRGNILQFGSTSTGNNDDVAAIIKLDSEGRNRSSFGKNGSQTVNVGTTGARFHNGAVLPDGSILAVGSGYTETATDPIGYGIVVKLKADGTLDGSFGDRGIVLYREKTSAQINTYFSNIFLLPGGQIVVCGALGYKAGFVRFNSDGTLDGSFGSNGRTLIPLDLSELWDADIQPDGKIVAVGRVETDIFDANYSDLIAVRINPNGTLDGSFGDRGIRKLDITPETDYDAEIFWAMELLPDGHILAFARIGSLPLDSAVVKFDADGSLDETFGSGTGFVKIDYDSRNNLARDLKVQPDGKIIIVGADGFPSNDFLIQRLNADGSTDTGFGTKGTTTLNFGAQDQPFAAVITDDNKLVVAGFGSSSPRKFALARFNLADRTNQLGIVRGRAFNLLGRAIKDTAIRVEDMSSGSVRSDVTDGNGIFRITLERNRTYRISASAARCIFQVPQITFDFVMAETVFDFKANCFRTIK